MKTSLKIAVLFVALFAMTACSAQRRAQRLVRRAVALCPELVQMKAHTIDTVLTAPGWADVVSIPVYDVAVGDTIYAATDHGTVVVSLCQPEGALRVGFVAAPQKILFQDTVQIPQVVTPAPVEKTASGRGFWKGLAIMLIGILLGAWVIVYLFRSPSPNK